MSRTKSPSSVAAMRRAVAAAPGTSAVPSPGPGEDASSLAVPTQLPPRPEKPVRFTLDLDRDRHGFLKRYAAEIEADASRVLRELLDQLRDDPDLSARVRTRIWQARAPHT